jgi:NAD(P)-dependent dehydrogenase (short-subunit alcohol dehydrogenase family)
VCVNYRESRGAADRVVTDCRKAGAEAIAVQADVVRLFEAVDRDPGRVTALVNSAGILEKQTRVEDTDAGRILRVFAAGVTGSFLWAREATRRMSTRRGGAGGSIVNVPSVAARVGSPGEYVDYAAAKGAIATLTLGLSKLSRRKYRWWTTPSVSACSSCMTAARSRATARDTRFSSAFGGSAARARTGRASTARLIERVMRLREVLFGYQSGR